jgi:hypothetical protein
MQLHQTPTASHLLHHQAAVHQALLLLLLLLQAQPQQRIECQHCTSGQHCQLTVAWLLADMPAGACTPPNPALQPLLGEYTAS